MHRLVDVPEPTDAGVLEADFEHALPDLARAAFADPSLRTNPRMPLLSEIVQLLRRAFDGRTGA